MKGMTRRIFLKNSGIAVFGASALPTFLRNAVAGTLPRRAPRKVLVVLFQRGAVDGLNVVVPYAESSYYDYRPTIGIPRPGRGGSDGAQGAALDLDGFFGLHPQLAPLLPLYRQGLLAAVHATGSPDSSRSHFDAQDYMEAGTPGVKSTASGWLNRALIAQPMPKPSALRAIAVSPSMPLTLRGSAPAIAVPDLRQFRFFGPPNLVEANFEAMYADASDPRLRETGSETFAAVQTLQQLDPEKYQPANGAQYPRGHFGRALREVAQLIKAGVGIEAAFLDSGGWDHHVNEGAVDGRLGSLLAELGQGMAAFAADMGPKLDDVVFVSMSEFGRTARENGDAGTDHGHGNYMFVMGGPVKGGKVYTRWPGLSPNLLNQDRDLKVTTDYRTVLAEILRRHLDVGNFSEVFPGFDADRSGNFLDLIRT